MLFISVPNAGFLPEGAQTTKKAIIFQILATKCMKIKDFLPTG